MTLAPTMSAMALDAEQLARARKYEWAPLEMMLEQMYPPIYRMAHGLSLLGGLEHAKQERDAKHGRAETAVPDAAGNAGLYRLLLDSYHIDDVYDRLVVRPFTAASDWLARVFDPAVIDGVVNGVAKVTRGFSLIWRETQTGNIQHYLIGFLAGTLALLFYYLRQQ